MEQYPHYLFAYTLGPSTQNDDGSWTVGASSWVLVSVCREEPNGAGKLVNLDDGKAVVYNSKVFMPKSASKIAAGTKIIVSETNSIEGFRRVNELPVIRPDDGQLHKRLWV